MADAWMEQMTGVSMLLLLALAGIIMYMRCDDYWREATIGFMFLQVCLSLTLVSHGQETND